MIKSPASTIMHLLVSLVFELQIPELLASGALCVLRLCRGEMNTGIKQSVLINI